METPTTYPNRIGNSSEAVGSILSNLVTLLQFTIYTAPSPIQAHPHQGMGWDWSASLEQRGCEAI